MLPEGSTQRRCPQWPGLGLLGAPQVGTEIEFAFLGAGAPALVVRARGEQGKALSRQAGVAAPLASGQFPCLYLPSHLKLGLQMCAGPILLFK